jgi:ABC-type multidrug transport system ATPase subunit
MAGVAKGSLVHAIRLEGLTRDFGPLRAVDDLSLEVPAGLVFGFLGPNGAGKTTISPTSCSSWLASSSSRRPACSWRRWPVSNGRG